MRISRTLCLLLVTVVLVFSSAAQRGHRDPPAVFQDEEKLPAAAMSHGPDPKLLMQQATELQQLSDAIPGDISKLNQGIVAKDLSERLKKIQKLAKQLRAEVQ